MGLNSAGMLAAVTSLTSRLGVFEMVNGHEPTSPATSGGLQASWWVGSVGSVPALSGLAVSAARLELVCRIETSADADRDGTEIKLLSAADSVFMAIGGDFDLDSHAPDGEDLGVWSVDLLGAYGNPLAAVAGYIREGNSAERRIMLINCPIIVKDVWAQG